MDPRRARVALMVVLASACAAAWTVTACSSAPATSSAGQIPQPDAHVVVATPMVPDATFDSPREDAPSPASDSGPDVTADSSQASEAAPAFSCAAGAPCDSYPECTTSEGVGLYACDLICSCDGGAFECIQDCPPDAAPPADCVPDAACVPGVWCGGDPPMCLCDNLGFLECAAGRDGG